MQETLVRTALEEYRQNVSQLKRGHRQEKYRLDRISRSFLGGKPVACVTSVDIARYRDQRLQQPSTRTGKPLSVGSVRLELALLSHFFETCRLEWGLCEHNPVSLIRKPRLPPGRTRRLSSRENRMILRYADRHSNPDLYSIIVLALETAMRQGEILSLVWEHVDLRRGTAHLPQTKNGSQRDVPLSPVARDAVMRLRRREQGPIFSYTTAGLQSTWRFMLDKLGIDNLRFHDLRHEAISRLFELGTLDTMEVASISGHRSLSMLRRYTHLRAQKLAKKLEKPRNRNRQNLSEKLVSYPALLEKEGTGYRVRLLDFDDISVQGASREEAVRMARHILLRRIVSSCHNKGEVLPQPDQYLEPVDERKLVLIDPMGGDDEETGEL
jgi:integrase/predicted RNase H-like HicB family nuclease